MKIKFIISIFACTLFLSTTQAQHENFQYSINPKLMPILKEYVGDLISYGVQYGFGDSLTVEMAEIDLNFEGIVEMGIPVGMNDNSKVEVYIDIKSWNKIDYNHKKWVLYHELTHDIYNTGHNEVKLMSDSIPENISDEELESAVYELMVYLKKKNK